MFIERRGVGFSALAELGASLSVLALPGAGFAAAPKQPVKATVRARVRQATAHAVAADASPSAGTPCTEVHATPHA